MAGNPGNLRTVDFLGLKVLLAGIFAAVAVLLLGVVFGNFVFGFVAGIGFALLGFVLPDFWLGRHISDRKKRILRAVPDTLDLLTISVKAAWASTARWPRSSRRRKARWPRSSGGCWPRCMGKARRRTARRGGADVPALTNFIGAIIQAEQLGVAISKVLQIQSEQLRIERRQHAEELAAKAPIKMLFPLVGCIFPSMFIVILGAGDHPDRAQLHDGDALNNSNSTVALVHDGRVVVGRIRRADSFAARFMGLMGWRSVGADEGLLLPAHEHPHVLHAHRHRLPVPCPARWRGSAAGGRPAPAPAAVAGRRLVRARRAGLHRARAWHRGAGLRRGAVVRLG